MADMTDESEEQTDAPTDCRSREEGGNWTIEICRRGWIMGMCDFRITGRGRYNAVSFLLKPH